MQMSSADMMRVHTDVVRERELARRSRKRIEELRLRMLAVVGGVDVGGLGGMGRG